MDLSTVAFLWYLVTLTLTPRPNDRNMPTQHRWAQNACVWQPCCNGVAACWVLFAQVTKWSNWSQQHPTSRNRVAKRLQHVALSNVPSCDMRPYVVLACRHRLAGAWNRRFSWVSNGNCVLQRLSRNTRTIQLKVNRQMSFSLPSIKCSAAPSSFQLLPSGRQLNHWAQFRQRNSARQ